jgi:hypothetical protein
MQLSSTCSGGGPVIAVPSELAAAWRGTQPPIGVEVPEGWSWGSGDIECDYDRACDTRTLSDYELTRSGGVGWLKLGDGAALILDAELVTAWLGTDDGGYIIRNYEESDLDAAAAQRYLDEAEAAGWRELSLEWVLTGGGIYLFDSAYAGAADPEAIGAYDGVAVGKIAPGTYRVATATTAGEADVIRVRRVG